MKDISNNRQPSFLFMKIDDDGNKYWRLNYNIVEKEEEQNETYFECDFVPENEGLISESPNFDMFVGELKSKGLSDDEIKLIQGNVQL